MASLKKRGKKYYAQYYLGCTQKRICLQTESYQVAREKIRSLESALARGDDNPLPTRTPIVAVVIQYVEHIRTVKTPKSAQTDVYYLRSAFGPVASRGTTTGAITARKLTVRMFRSVLRHV